MALPTDQLERIAESVVGTVQWREPGIGYCACPGADLHQNGNGRKDCRVTVVPGRNSDAPTIYCFHSHCSEVVAESNRKLRSLIGKAKVRDGGAAPPGQPRQGTPPTTRGPAARTLRMPFFNILKAPKGGAAQSRTVRIGFLPPYAIGSENDIRKGVGCEPSEPSEVAAVVLTSENLSEPSGDMIETEQVVTWLSGRIEQGGDFRTCFTRYVDAQGSVHHAHVSDDDQGRRIRIGRKIYQGQERST